MEGLARRCIALTGELIRKGRSVLCLTILATQKTTGDSIPTSLRDNSGLAVSFALKTTESSVAALGDAIREYPGYSPTLLARDTQRHRHRRRHPHHRHRPVHPAPRPRDHRAVGRQRAAATPHHRRTQAPAEPSPSRQLVPSPPLARTE